MEESKRERERERERERGRVRKWIPFLFRLARERKNKKTGKKNLKKLTRDRAMQTRWRCPPLSVEPLSPTTVA
jgi:hypothetical protein